jgi:hypothetical protein
MSKGFSHYVKYLNSEKHLMFKGMRKNYITMLEVYKRGGDIKVEDITDHKDFEVIDKHYLDKTVKAMKISGEDFRL